MVIGAGAGLSTSAGLVYNGERFERYFSDFRAKYGFEDMYTGGFFPFAAPEEHWAYWSRYIWVNRYMDAPKPVYDALLDLAADKDLLSGDVGQRGTDPPDDGGTAGYADSHRTAPTVS